MPRILSIRLISLSVWSTRCASRIPALTQGPVSLKSHIWITRATFPDNEGNTPLQFDGSGPFLGRFRHLLPRRHQRHSGSDHSIRSSRSRAFAIRLSKRRPKPPGRSVIEISRKVLAANARALEPRLVVICAPLQAILLADASQLWGVRRLWVYILPGNLLTLHAQRWKNPSSSRDGLILLLPKALPKERP